MERDSDKYALAFACVDRQTVERSAPGSAALPLFPAGEPAPGKRDQNEQRHCEDQHEIVARASLPADANYTAGPLVGVQDEDGEREQQADPDKDNLTRV